MEKDLIIFIYKLISTESIQEAKFYKIITI